MCARHLSQINATFYPNGFDAPIKLVSYIIARAKQFLFLELILYTSISVQTYLEKIPTPSYIYERI